MARIEYLSELEIKKFEKAPEFENNIERNYYFKHNYLNPRNAAFLINLQKNHIIKFFY